MSQICVITTKTDVYATFYKTIINRVPYSGKGFGEYDRSESWQQAHDKCCISAFHYSLTGTCNTSRLVELPNATADDDVFNYLDSIHS